MKKLSLWGPPLFLVFLLLSFLVYNGVFSQFDREATGFLQSHIPRSFDFLFSVFSLIGTFEISTLILFLVLFYFKKLNRLMVLGTYGIVLIVEMIGKSVIPQIAPPIELVRTKIFLSFPTGEVSQAFYAYPSGHVSRTAFISVILILAIWKSGLEKGQKIALGFLSTVFLLVMAISRVYLAEHWASDVMGGIILGSAVGLLTFNLQKKRFK